MLVPVGTEVGVLLLPVAPIFRASQQLTWKVLQVNARELQARDAGSTRLTWQISSEMCRPQKACRVTFKFLQKPGF